MKISFIGAGNMGSAIIGGIVSSNLASPTDITVADRDENKLNSISSQYGVNTTTSNIDCVSCDMLFLCVKPNVIYSVIDEIKDKVGDNTIIVSIAAGQSIKKMTDAFGKSVKIIRVMPNTPALVGEGMAAISLGSTVTDTEAEAVLDIFNSIGKAEVVAETLMDTVTAVSGSSPAYVFMLIEAMADAAASEGMDKALAYTFAAQSVLGSAKMVMETDISPVQLKENVCSPGGTTIEAVAVFEKEDLHGMVGRAMKACAEKSKRM